MPIQKNFLSGGRELSQISMAKDVRGLSTWVASLLKRTIDAVNQTNQAAVSSNEVSGAPAQVLATPATSSGTAAPTTLTSAYLPPATSSAIGAVKPDGTTITVSAGGIISATASEPISGPGNEVFATPDGSAGAAELRALVPADLPVATTSDVGAVKPDGTTITISGGTISASGSTPSGPANEVYATPDGSSGDASIRALVPADLPVATTSDLGVC